MEVAFEDGDEFVDVEMTIVVDIDVIEHRHQILFFEFVSEIIDDGQEALQSDLALLALAQPLLSLRNHHSEEHRSEDDGDDGDEDDR